MENFIEIAQLVVDFLGSIADIFTGASGTVTSFSDLLQNLTVLLELLAAICVAIIGAITTLLTAAIGLTATAVVILIAGGGAVLLAGYGLVRYLLYAIPLYKVAKHANCKQAGLVWIPFFQPLLCTFVLSRVDGKGDFGFFNGKLKIKENLFIIFAYVLIHFFANGIILLVVLVINLIPAAGQVISLASLALFLIPPILKGIVEYVVLRDTIDVFKPDRKKNKAHAFVVTALDKTITGGWARVFYLMSLTRMRPLMPVVSQNDVPVLTGAEPLLIEQ